MLVPCVVKEAVSKFDAGRDGKKEKREQRETRRLFSEGGRKGGRDAREMDHPRSSEHRFFFFFYKRRDQDESLGIKPSRRNGLV